MTIRPYVGSELELVSRYHNWKEYLSGIMRPYVRGCVLEVGAGIGSVTRMLCGRSSERWVCLEPDPTMSAMLQSRIREGLLPACCEVVTGMLADVPKGETFDTILYVDVLEHIERDGEETAAAATLLKPGGMLMVLAPAHQWLYSPFDESIGHYRRYSKRSLSAIIPAFFECAELKYLDSAGLLASLGNRLVLRSAMPSPAQLAIWDRVLIPFSRIMDPLLLYRVGKSVFGAWRKRVRHDQPGLGPARELNGHMGL